MVVAGATLILTLLDRLPILVWGVVQLLLGWIAGDVTATDPAVQPRLQTLFGGAVGMESDALLALPGVGRWFADGGRGGELVCSMLGIVAVLIVGSVWRRRRLRNIAIAG